MKNKKLLLSADTLSRYKENFSYSFQKHIEKVFYINYWWCYSWSHNAVPACALCAFPLLLLTLRWLQQWNRFAMRWGTGLELTFWLMVHLFFYEKVEEDEDDDPNILERIKISVLIPRLLLNLHKVEPRQGNNVSHMLFSSRLIGLYAL